MPERAIRPEGNPPAPSTSTFRQAATPEGKRELGLSPKLYWARRGKRG